MPNYELDSEYMSIVSDIFSNIEYMKLKDIKHHNHTRLKHCIKISYYAYKITKKLKLDYVETARAGLLHDFYLGQVNDQKGIIKKVLLFTTKHPKEAIENSSKFFHLSEKEKDIIRTHMFPVDIYIPRYAESWIVSLVDKAVSFKEFGFKFYNKLFSKASLFIIVLLSNLR